ncbi:MAG TPA: hypoxanthine-guanine phosphoribosyltransferase [Usitatibacter sp.]|jgi:hypoxanthine phosphoribosyltransferase|nr:hypoxanthine-guanine phosphoribosyltransferase [Usitatibacter sp.]
MKNRREAQRLLDEADLLFPAEAVNAAVERMARDIAARLADEFPVVLSVMGGAAVFTGRLLPLLAFPLEFGAIEVTRYNNDIQGRDIAWRLAPRDNVRDRTVLVLDDILDEGITLAAIRAKLTEMGAARVLSAVFADKDLGRAKPAQADFVGVTVPNRYVFGFGMDAYGLWRNLPAIYALREQKPESPQISADKRRSVEEDVSGPK